VLQFEMPHDSTQRFAPMLNIQQFYVERFACEAAQTSGQWASVLWNARMTLLTRHRDKVVLQVAQPDLPESTITANFVVACDGGKSTVRENLGVRLEGMQYEGRYVIVDIEQSTAKKVERLAWFDPPSNPGSTILMHRQPDNVWRIDYQLADDEDAEQAVKPEVVLPRVQSHLSMIGETAQWKPLWISIYNAKCLTLAQYRYDRVLFAGDAAHMVPIFGVRGLNSGIDDAGNLAWKLALCVKYGADMNLLDTYSTERVHATQENLAYGAKSTEFMSPPTKGFDLMREAALRLAGEYPNVAALLNPRQSLPVAYPATYLTGPALGPAAGLVGMALPEALLALPDHRDSPTRHLSTYLGSSFLCISFADRYTWVGESANLSELACLTLSPMQGSQVWQRLSAQPGTTLLVRPDGYVLAAWNQLNHFAIEQVMAPFRNTHAR
jgi:3-(3-hydroxy-phenyl)propionate hydroxylase